MAETADAPGAKPILVRTDGRQVTPVEEEVVTALQGDKLVEIIQKQGKLDEVVTELLCSQLQYGKIYGTADLPAFLGQFGTRPLNHSTLRNWAKTFAYYVGCATEDDYRFPVVAVARMRIIYYCLRELRYTYEELHKILEHTEETGLTLLELQGGNLRPEELFGLLIDVEHFRDSGEVRLNSALAKAVEAGQTLPQIREALDMQTEQFSEAVAAATASKSAAEAAMEAAVRAQTDAQAQRSSVENWLVDRRNQLDADEQQQHSQVQRQQQLTGIWRWLARRLGVIE